MAETTTLPAISPQPPAAESQPWRITSSNASTLAKLSWQKRRERAASKADLPAPAQSDTQPSDYVVMSLTRVREHLARIDGLLSKATDTQDIERLSRSRRVLGQAEQELAGRPLPGSRRPGKEQRERLATVEPL